MNRRKFLQVLLTIAALGALGVWSYTSGSPSATGAVRNPSVGGGSGSGGQGSTDTAKPKADQPKGETPATTAPAGPTTTIARNPQAYDQALFAEWKSRSRDDAAHLGNAAFVKMLFARPWHDADAWVDKGCKPATGGMACTWVSPHRTFVLQLRAATATLPLQFVAMQIIHTN